MSIGVGVCKFFNYTKFDVKKVAEEFLSPDLMLPHALGFFTPTSRFHLFSLGNNQKNKLKIKIQKHPMVGILLKVCTW